MYVSLPGTYTVIIKDACIKTFTITIDTVKCTTNISTNATNNGFAIYPNPAESDIVTLYFNQLPTNIYTVSIYAADGRLIQSKSTKDKVFVFNLADISNGIYLIKVTIDGQTITQKLCVVK
jgi:hypothetical protein